jgi:NodT family efflux transporter outer membrane factor (OMF) lipoprotein
VSRRPARAGKVRRAGDALLVVLLAALGACRVGPDYRTPDLPAGVAAPFESMQASAQSAESPPDPWWRLYDDPRLDGLVLEALQANQTLAAADANFAAARAVLTAVHAERYPSTHITAGGIRGRDAVTDEILELGGHAPQTIWLYEDVFDAAYEVDLFGRVHRAIEVAAANADSVGAARDAVRVVVAAEAARGYAAICALGEQLGVARHSYEVVAHEADIARRRHEAGANSVFDVTRAEGLVEQVRASIPTLEGQRRVALFALAAVLGRAPKAAPMELESCMTPPRLIAVLPVGDGAALIQRRPDVRQAERRLAAATAQIGVATADLYPSIRLVGLYGGAASSLTALDTNIGRTWGLGPSISWNFPNWSLPRARVRQAKAQQAAALAAFDGVVLTALEEIEQALSTYAAALANREALVAARDKSDSAYRIAHDQFAAGAVSNLDLLTTEQSLVALDASVAAADATLIQDQIAVFKALGGGWRDASQSR